MFLQTILILIMSSKHVASRFDRLGNVAGSRENIANIGPQTEVTDSETSDIECRSNTIQQVVHHPGCTNRTIQNLVSNLKFYF